MKGFILSFRSEFYKTRKTMAFWSALVLPFLLCGLVSVGFYFTKSQNLLQTPPSFLWIAFSSVILGPIVCLCRQVFICLLPDIYVPGAVYAFYRRFRQPAGYAAATVAIWSIQHGRP